MGTAGTGEELKMVSTISTRIVWLEILELKFQDDQFISEIFWSVRPKLSYHLHSDRNFWKFCRLSEKSFVLFIQYPPDLSRLRRSLGRFAG